jgi:DNA-binding NarL/FixJ family response regulator
MKTNRASQAITLMVVDDERKVRKTIRLLLAGRKCIEVIEAEDGEEAVRLAAQHEPDVVLMDLAMPDMDGAAATRLILDHNQKTKVIALSGHLDELTIRAAFDAGVSGFQSKNCQLNNLLTAMQIVLADGKYMSPDVTKVMVANYLKAVPPPDPALLVGLTPTEREVLRLIADGFCTKEIAQQLEMSDRTAERHRQSIMDKLNCHSVAALTKVAVCGGLTPLKTLSAW